MEDVKLYRHKINKALEPIKVMLVNKRITMTHEEWLDFVEHTKLCVLHSPEQYLDLEFPAKDIVSLTVMASFDDFLKDIEARAPRNFKITK